MNHIFFIHKPSVPVLLGIDFWENLGETPLFDGNNHGRPCRFSQNQTIEGWLYGCLWYTTLVIFQVAMGNLSNFKVPFWDNDLEKYLKKGGVSIAMFDCWKVLDLTVTLPPLGKD